MPRKCRTTQASRRYSRLALERLEERLTPAQVAWAVDANGFWDVPGNWSTGAVPGPNDDVIIDRPAGDFTVTIRQGTSTVHSITARERLVVGQSGSGAVLTVNGPVDAPAGLTVSSATLAGATIPAGTTVRSDYATLRGLTVNGTIDLSDPSGIGRTLTVTNGLTLNGTMILDSPYCVVGFAGVQTLGGTGTVRFGNVTGSIPFLGPDYSGPLTIGPNVKIVGGNGRIGGGGGAIINYGSIVASGAGLRLSIADLENRGQVRAENGATLNIGIFGGNSVLTNHSAIEAENATLLLEAPFRNYGRVDVRNSTVRLGAGRGAYTLAELGNFRRTGGTVELVGTLDNRNTIFRLDSSTGPWRVNGTITGGTLDVASPEFLAIGNATYLDGVTLEGTIDMTQDGAVIVRNGLTVNGTLLVGAPNNYRSVTFDGTQTLSGTGRIVFANSGTPNQFAPSAYTTTTLTIAPTLSIQAGSVSVGGSMEIVVNNAISATNGLVLLNRLTRFNGQGGIVTAPQVILQVGGDLLGNTRNPASFNPRGPVWFRASGVQQLEVMSQDRGAAAAGFRDNFAFGPVEIFINSQLRLVDLSDNAPGTAPEVFYAEQIVLDPFATLDLNGFTAYTRGLVIGSNAQVINGTVVRIPDSGPIEAAVTTAGRIGLAGEQDDWTFYGRRGRTVTVVVSPGTAAQPAPVAPTLQWAEVRLLDASGGVVASARNTQAGQAVTLNDILLPIDGTYRIQVTAAPSQSNSTGNYLVTLWDSTADDAKLPLNETVAGRVEGQFSADRWRFAVAPGQSVQFDLAGAAPGLRFRLTGPGGTTVFNDLAADSGPITLLASGEHVLTAYGPGGAIGDYAFTMRSLNAIELTLGTPYNGTLGGNGQYQLFLVKTFTATSLAASIDRTGSGNDVVLIETYVRMGTPPTRSEAQFESTTPGSGQRIVIPVAAPGDWYVLVYTVSAPPQTNFRLIVSAEPIVLGQVTPNRVGAGAETVLAVTGAGFAAGTVVELVGANNQAYSGAVTVEAPDRLRARFAAGAVPPGVYAVRASRAGTTARLDNAVTVVAGGQPRLVTRLALPNGVAFHFIYSELFLEYANRGDVAMPAPLLVLHANRNAVMTLDRTLLVPGGFQPYARVPEGFSDTVQVLASGATPGLLQPGESARVSVYFAGLQYPQGATVVDFTLTVSTQDQTEPADWPALRDSLRPRFVAPEAWAPIFANLVSQIGPTWGGYVRMLNDNAAYLGRLGLRETDAAQLFAFELQQASGLHPVRTLAESVDAAVETPGLGLGFGRFATNSILGRYELGGFGRGWHAPWEERLVIEPSDFDPVAGSVYVTGPAGARRRFPYFNGGYRFSYHSELGDESRMTRNSDGSFDLREADGLLRHFRPDGRLDYLQDLNGNRVTTTYTGGQLTRLSHSSGQFLSISYNAAGRISGITDSEGETTQYAYDAANEHLLSVRHNDGRTVRYTYGTAAGAAREHALTSIQEPSGVTRTFEYDSAGRLTSTYLTGNAERVDYLFDSAGGVTVRDAAGSGRVYFDDRGLVVQAEDAISRITRFTIDDEFHLTRVTDAAGLSTAFAYDDRGNLIRVTDELGRATQFAYGRFVTNVQTDRLTAVTDANGNTTRYNYDTRGNPSSTTYPNNSIERVVNDALGNVQVFINRRGRAIAFTRNAAGQVTRKTYADGSTVNATYDAHGNLATLTDADGTIRFDYDAGDRLTRVAYPTGRSLQYTYDAAGRRTRMADQDGFTVNYAYDAAGRLERLTDTAGALIVRYNYDAAGRIARKDLGGGGFATYDYDAAGQLLHLVNRGSDNSAHSRFDYTYDVLGRRAGMTTPDGAWAFEYDATGQLTRAVFASTNPAIPNQDLRYIYDAVGNRVRAVINGVTTDYVINGLNQYVQVGNDRYDYDADGNLIAITTSGGTSAFSYDDENRLVGAAAPGGTWAYDYDALGNLASATRNGQRTEYLINPTGIANVVGEYGAGATTRYVHSFGLIGRFDAAGSHPYEFDGLGNVVAMLTPNGQVQNRYAFGPFGERLLSQEAVANPFQFAGRFGVVREANGLDFMRARFYAPQSGRFLSADPIGLSGGGHLYAYAANNPVTYADPTGHRNVFVGETPSGRRVYKPFDDQGDVAPEAAPGTHEATGDAHEGQRVGRNEDGTFYDEQWAKDGDITEKVTYNPETGELYSEASDREVDGGGDPGLPGGGDPGLPGGGDPGVPGGGDPGLRGGAFGSGRGRGQSAPRNPFSPAPTNPVPPPAPGAGSSGGSVGSATSYDPNAKTGPAGFGAPNFVRSDGLLPYRVDFENDATATAPAQRVDVTDQLDARLDWDSLEFTTAGFGDTRIEVPPGRRHFRTTVPMQYNGRDFQVDVELDFDSTTGKVRATFRAYDPSSFLGLDVLTGFLPPEDGSGRGQGFFTYVVRPDAGLPSGTAVRNVADIRFDYAAIIATNQVDAHNPAAGTDPNKEALVTLDAGLPSSSVQALPAVTNTASFLVRWSGTDDVGGSGVDTYDVYVSDNGGPFTLWQVGTPATSAVYNSQNSHTYAFYSVATDHVGHRQVTPAVAQATTRSDTRPPLLLSVAVNDGSVQRSMVKSITVTFNQVVTLDVGAFVLRSAAGSVVGLNQAVSVENGQTVVTLTFTGADIVGGSLADGRYVLTVVSNRVRDSLGNPLDGDADGQPGGDNVASLFRLFGDVNGDGAVNGLDVAAFRTAFGSSAADPTFRAFLDFNGDGAINGLDLAAFRSRFGTVLP